MVTLHGEHTGIPWGRVLCPVTTKDRGLTCELWRMLGLEGIAQVSTFRSPLLTTHQAGQ